MNAEPARDTAIGIDIGGTKMALGIVDGSGVVRAQVVLPTEAEAGFDRAVARLGDAIEALCGEAGTPVRDLAGIGIGCAGPLDPGRGLINNPYTLAGWDKCDIVTPLRARFGVRVQLENDADAAAMGECFAGAGRGFDPIVMLTLGTGVGGAAIVRGEIYRGANGEHPELGHVIVSDNGPPCYCGCRGCLESLASGTAIGAFGQTEGFADARAVFAGARNGKTGARTIVDRALAAAAAGGVDGLSHLPAAAPDSGRGHRGRALRPVCRSHEPASPRSDTIHGAGRRDRACTTGQRGRHDRRRGACPSLKGRESKAPGRSTPGRAYV